MSNDKKNKIALLAAYAVILLGVVLFAWGIKNSHGQTTAETKTETAKQAVISSQAATDRAKSEYIATLNKDIQKQKEVARNAVEKGLCETYSSDFDALTGWSELVARARGYNANAIGNGDNGSDQR